MIPALALISLLAMPLNDSPAIIEETEHSTLVARNRAERRKLAKQGRKS